MKTTKKSNSDHTMLSQSTAIEKDWAGGFYFGTQVMIIFSIDLQKIPELISCGCEMPGDSEKLFVRTSVVLLLGLKCDEYSVDCQIRLAKNLADDEETTLGGQDKWIIKMSVNQRNKVANHIAGEMSSQED